MWLKGSPLRLSTERIKRILLIQLGDIGDVVVSLPCVRALKDNFPDAQVVVAVRAKARELIDICPWADEVISIDQHRLRMTDAIRYQIAFFRRLRAFRFDLVLDLRAGTRGAVLAYLSGAAIRVGFYSTKEPLWRDWAFTHLKPFMPDPNRHQSVYYQSLLTECGINILHPFPEIVVSEKLSQEAIQFLIRHKVDLDKPIVAVHPFALWRYKEWPIERTTQLVQFLSQERDRTVLILGASSERTRAQSITDRCNRKVVNLAGQTGLGILAAVVQKCALLIGMDSALGHISAAVGTPAVTIFGPGKPGVWAPLGERSRIVHRDLPCIYCGQKGCDGTGRSRCLEELSVEQVLSAIAEHTDGSMATIRVDRRRAPGAGR